MENKKDLSKELDKTLKKDNLEKVGIGISEVLTDAVLEEGILKDIPIIGTLVGLSKAGASLKDRLLIKKILSFLSEIDVIPAEKRASMIDDINDNGKFKIRVGEKLLYIIDRCEDHEKAVLTAVMFKSFLTERISYSDFIRSAKILEDVPIDELELFVNSNWCDLEIDVAADLITWGLFEFQTHEVEIASVREANWPSAAKYELRGEVISASISQIGIKIRECLKNEF
ncbi:MAG: hypothetical protein R8G66_30465 [Cytophagales bacterium]|nr:hypothetical protein [Cytophagales bacterium]